MQIESIMLANWLENLYFSYQHSIKEQSMCKKKTYLQEINNLQYRKLFHVNFPLLFKKYLYLFFEDFIGVLIIFTLPSTAHFDLFPFFSDPNLWSVFLNMSFPNILIHTAFYWSMADLLGTRLLAKTNPFFTSIQQLPIVPWLGMQLYSQLSSPGWNLFWLRLAQFLCMLLQLLGYHTCSCSVVSRR